MPTPASRNWRMTRNRSATSCAFRAAVGSSMISTRESNDSALAISTICWRATVRSATSVRGSRLRFRRSKSRRALALRRSSSRNRPRPRRGSRPMKMFCAALRCRIRLSSWCTMPMPSACAPRGLPMSTGRPSMSISPASHRWMPASTFISVDLPAPFSPISACTSPARSSNPTWSSAWTPAKLLHKPRMETSVSMSGEPVGSRCAVPCSTCACSS